MITKVRLVKTLKAGNDVWIAGLELPNRAMPVIPDTLLKEVRRRTGTVEVLEQKTPPPIPVPKIVISDTKTSTTLVSKTSNDITPLTVEEEEFEEQVKGIPQEGEDKAQVKTDKTSPKKRSKKAPEPKRELKPRTKLKLQVRS